MRSNYPGPAYLAAACLAAIFPSTITAAANMAMSAVTVNSSGQLTFTMSPCVSPLSPASGVTGISISDATNTYAQTVASATTSGCTVTVTTQANASLTYPITADDATTSIAVTLASTSNLTDGAGNTVAASGNSGVHPSTNGSTWMPALGTAIAGKIQLDGNPSLNSQGGVKTALWGSANGCARFNANVTGINILAFNYNNAWVLLQDGAQLGSVQVTSSGTNWSVYALGSGLSGSHLYEICEVGPSPAPGLGALQLVGGTGFGAQPAAKPWVLFFGASEMNPSWFTPGTGSYAAYDTRNHVSWLTMRPFGYAVQYLGQAGWTVTSNTAGATQYVSNLRDCAKGQTMCTSATFAFGSTPPSFIVVDEGGNDTLVSTTIGSGYATAGTFGGDAVTMLQNLAARFSPAKLLVIDQYCAAGIPTCPNNAQVPYKIAWHGATAYYNSLSPAVPAISVNTFNQGCVNFSTDFQPVGYHLNPQGQADWANCLLPAVNALINGVSYSTSGALSGTNNHASNAISVTLAAGATFSTGNSCSQVLAGSTCQSITLSDGGAGGTFSVAGGVSGPSPLKVTPTNATTNFQFTYTPTTTNTVKITFSNGQGGWIDPPPLYFVPASDKQANGILLGRAGQSDKKRAAGPTPGGDE